MKKLGFLFAFYLLAVACLPCNDSKACSCNFVQTVSNASHETQHHNVNDICPPFCSCSCCTGFSINQTVTTSGYTPFTRDTHFLVFSSGDLIEISLPVWQPPRL
ncbi:MAG: hypothetical protein LC128_13635 [Chitinophagales bacterium]|nr:hypothetical protein [Chitinophagales bacterium]